MQLLFELKENIATLDELFEEIKYLTSIHFLKADAKQKLLIIIIQHLKIVSQYYEQIFKL